MKAEQKVKKNDLANEIQKIKTKEELTLFLEDIINRLGEKNLSEKEIFKIEKNLLSFPVLRLEIAFKPTDEFIKKLSDWVEKEAQQKVILDIVVNPKVVAGALIEYQGIFRDYSLSKRIEELS